MQVTSCYPRSNAHSNLSSFRGAQTGEDARPPLFECSPFDL
jgi:hypothetical protein